MEPERQADSANAELSNSRPTASTAASPAPATAVRSKTPLLHHDEHEHGRPTPPRAAGRISKTLVNFWLDGILGAIFVTLCIIAVIVQFVFPPGVSARGASLWGMSYGQWCSLQFAILAVLGLGVLLHVMLHWTWVCSVLSKRILNQKELPDDGIRTVYGVGLLIALLLIGAVCIGMAQWMIALPE